VKEKAGERQEKKEQKTDGQRKTEKSPGV